MSVLKPEAVTFLAVHCSATTPTQDIGAKEIDRMHRERGFFKIGYHYVIRRNGTVEKGREDTEIGAHVEGFNHCSLGICLIGGVEHPDHVRRDHLGNVISLVPSNNFTLEQMHALAVLLMGLQHKFPNADIQGHRDFPNVHKDCPCFDVRAWWQETVQHPDLKS